MEEVVGREKYKQNMKKLTPNFNTLSDIIDRLCVEINKLSFAENRKREEQKKETPNYESIAIWDNRSRDSCELRDLLKREFDSILSEIVREGEYKVAKTWRTFSPPEVRVSDIICERYKEIADEGIKGKLAEAFEEEFNARHK